MYNPRQDIVAGRTARQIESAKRRAVKGGGRKRCRKGKSCGATCINGSKVCLVDLPWVSSNGLSRVAQDIQNRPKSSVDSLTRNLGLQTGKVKPLSIGSLDEVSKAGKSFMDKYKGRLDAAFSIWNRRIAVEEKIKDRINNGNLSFREKMRLRKALQSIISRSARANERSFKLMEEIRRELLKTKLSESDIKGILSLLKIEGKNLSSDSALIKQVRSQVEEFARMFNGKGLLEASDRKGFFTASLREISVNTTDRAHAIGNFIMTSGIPRVTFHELGHIVENGRPWLADYAEKWRDGKAFTLRQVESAKGSEVFVKGLDGKIIPHATRELSGRDVPVFRLVDMPVNKNRGYDPQEIAVADKFMDLYMGKVYGWRGSEVISMGIETFSSPQDMRHLYVNHPDLFETVVGLALT